MTDAIELGAMGLVELHLKPEEEAVLNRPLEEDAVALKPTGQPYLPHAKYTAWFNDAFGRLGWAIVPASKPMLAQGSVICPYVLYVHGSPVAFAMGEQTYHENNKEQTYGDAIESTVASALRRCAKRLGVGLTLWDRRWCDAFVAKRGVKVSVVKRDGQVSYQWRLISDPPFWNETQGSPSPSGEPAPAQRRDALPYDDNAPITDKQRQRFAIILRKSGRDTERVRDWLTACFGWRSSKQITRRHYEFICTAIEAPGDLPQP